MNDLEERVRQRAYQLWEEEGRPEGRAEVHWEMAWELIVIEDDREQARKPVSEIYSIGPADELIEPLEPTENAREFPTSAGQGEEET
jgi:Protein of unknown function (DUF2934)